MKRSRHRQAESELGAALQLYPAGVTLLRQGAAVPEVYVLQRGLVKLSYAGANGCELMLGLRATGDWLGGEAVVLQTPAFHSAVTLTECGLYRLAAAAYLARLDTDPPFARERHAAQSRELLAQMQHAADLVCVTPRQRLEQLLWQMAGGGRRAVRLQLPLQRQELAALLAVTPSHLSRLFKQLEKAGLLQGDNGWVLLPKPDALWRAREAVPRVGLGAPPVRYGER